MPSIIYCYHVLLLIACLQAGHTHWNNSGLFLLSCLHTFSFHPSVHSYSSSFLSPFLLIPPLLCLHARAHTSTHTQPVHSWIICSWLSPTSPFVGKSVFFEENSRRGSTAYAWICDRTAHARTCAQGIFEETVRDFLGKWGIFEVNMRDSQAKDGIFKEKTRVFRLKRVIFPKEMLFARKVAFVGCKCGIFRRKVVFSGTRCVTCGQRCFFSGGKCVIFGRKLVFSAGQCVIFVRKVVFSGRQCVIFV